MKFIDSSEILQNLAEEMGDKNITPHALTERLSERGFGLIILVLALPNLVPIILPGLSTITGLLIIIFALQMILGRKEIYLPEKFAYREFSGVILKHIVKYCSPTLKFIERFMRPRLVEISDKSERLVGSVILIMAVIMFLPIPLMNFIPAFCISFLALGFLQKDGMVIFIAIFISITALVLKYKLISTILLAIFIFLKELILRIS